MRKTLLGWLVLAFCFVLLGAGTVVGARISRRDALDQGTIAKWRQYAAEVEQGKQTASPIQVNALTVRAIERNDYAAADMALRQFLGRGVAVLGLVLGADVARNMRRGARGEG
jgi:hypothetical protein